MSREEDTPRRPSPGRPEPGPVEAVIFDWGGTLTPWHSIDLGEQDFLKRVAGVGGDRVSCTPKGGLVVNGSPVDEPWLAPGTTACDTPFDVKVPQGRLFVLGDNRSDSADSRSHLGDPGGGMVPVDDVVGHVSWRYWPIDRIGGLGH